MEACRVCLCVCASINSSRLLHTTVSTATCNWAASAFCNFMFIGSACCDTSRCPVPARDIIPACHRNEPLVGLLIRSTARACHDSSVLTSPCALQRVAKLSPAQWAQLCKLRLLVGNDLDSLKRQRWDHISALVVGALAVQCMYRSERAAAVCC